MAQSREEFLRQMGITMDDIRPTPGGSDLAAASGPRRVERVRSEQPPMIASSAATRTTAVKQRVTKAVSRDFSDDEDALPLNRSTAGSTKQSAREEFLKAMGIDNMHHPDESSNSSLPPNAPPPPHPIPEKRQTASQEAYRDSIAVMNEEHKIQRSASHTQSPSRTANLMRKLQGTDSCEEEHLTPSSSFHSQPQADIMLGAKKLRPAPSVPHLDKQAAEIGDEDPEAIKALGNKYFEAGDFRKAVRIYSKAISLDPSNAILYSNRSAAYLQGAKQMGIDTRTMALRDADKVIELRKDWFKGFARRGDALFKLEQYADAARAFEQALVLDPNNVNLIHSLGECKNAAGIGSRSTAKTLGSLAAAPKRSAPEALNTNVHDLVEQLRREVSATTPENLIGEEYRVRELERFRERHSMSSSFRSANDGDGNSSRPSTVNSDLGASYRNSLLEAFRRKKN